MHNSIINDIDITSEKSTKRAIFLRKEWTELRNLIKPSNNVIQEADNGEADTVLIKKYCNDL